MELFTDPDSLAHKGDPQTSRRAAVRLVESGAHAAQSRIVLAALKAHPGLTSKQLAEQANLDRYTVARRLPDLRKAGLVRCEDAKPGGKGVRWFPTEGT